MLIDFTVEHLIRDPLRKMVDWVCIAVSYNSLTRGLLTSGVDSDRDVLHFSWRRAGHYCEISNLRLCD